MEVLPTLAVTLVVVAALGLAYLVHRSEEAAAQNPARDIHRDQSAGAAGFGFGDAGGGDGGGGSC